MKNFKFLTVFMMSIFMLTSVSSIFAAKKNVQKCVISTSIHCKSCVSKIEKNLRFEKGIKKFKVNFKKQTIAITYRADKTTPKALALSLTKMGYKSKVAELIHVHNKYCKHGDKKHNHKKHEHKHGEKCNHKH